MTKVNPRSTQLRQAAKQLALAERANSAPAELRATLTALFAVKRMLDGHGMLDQQDKLDEVIGRIINKLEAV